MVGEQFYTLGKILGVKMKKEKKKENINYAKGREGKIVHRDEMREGEDGKKGNSIRKGKGEGTLGRECFYIGKGRLYEGPGRLYSRVVFREGKIV